MTICHPGNFTQTGHKHIDREGKNRRASGVSVTYILHKLLATYYAFNIHHIAMLGMSNGVRTRSLEGGGEKEGGERERFWQTQG